MSHCVKGCKYAAKTVGVNCCGYAQRELGRKTVLLTACEIYHIDKNDFPAIHRALEEHGCPCYEPGKRASTVRALSAKERKPRAKKAPAAPEPHLPEKDDDRPATLEDLEELVRGLSKRQLRTLYEKLREKYK